MNELEEKVAMLEELVQEFLKRIETVETTMPEFLRTFLEQYKQTIEKIGEMIEAASKRYDEAKIQRQIDELGRLIAAAPKVVDVRNHHHFGAWSKNLIIGLATCFIAMSLSVGAALHLYSENSRLSENDIKYRMVRQYYPQVAVWAERKYAHDPDSARVDVERMEVEQEALRLAEEIEKKKRAELIESKNNAEALRKKRHERGNK